MSELTREKLYIAIVLSMAETCPVTDKNRCKRCVYEDDCTLIRTNEKAKEYFDKMFLQ